MKNGNANVKSVATTLFKELKKITCKYGSAATTLFFFSFSVFKTRAKLETDFDLTSAR